MVAITSGGEGSVRRRALAAQDPEPLLSVTFVNLPISPTRREALLARAAAPAAGCCLQPPPVQRILVAAGGHGWRSSHRAARLAAASTWRWIPRYVSLGCSPTRSREAFAGVTLNGTATIELIIKHRGGFGRGGCLLPACHPSGARAADTSQRGKSSLTVAGSAHGTFPSSARAVDPRYDESGESGVGLGGMNPCASCACARPSPAGGTKAP